MSAPENNNIEKVKVGATLNELILDAERYTKYNSYYKFEAIADLLDRIYEARNTKNNK